jgi:hypothetical protein
MAFDFFIKQRLSVREWEVLILRLKGKVLQSANTSQQTSFDMRQFHHSARRWLVIKSPNQAPAA